MKLRQHKRPRKWGGLYQTTTNRDGGALHSALFALAGLALTCTILFAVEPDWWGPIKDANQVQTNLAAANVGQLKNMAQQAMDTMDGYGYGAGDAIHTLVTGWQNDTTSNNHVALTAGQLKSVGKVFYDRLGALGILPPGQYPWTAATDNHAVVNVGQLKNVFSFALPITPPALGTVSGNGQVVAVNQTGQNRLTVNISGGLSGRSVTFSVSDGSVSLDGITWSSSVTTSSDSDGNASVYYRAGSAAGNATVTATLDGTTTQTTFELTIDTPVLTLVGTPARRGGFPGSIQNIGVLLLGANSGLPFSGQQISFAISGPSNGGSLCDVTGSNHFGTSQSVPTDDTGAANAYVQLPAGNGQLLQVQAQFGQAGPVSFLFATTAVANSPGWLALAGIDYVATPAVPSWEADMSLNLSEGFAYSAASPSIPYGYANPRTMVASDHWLALQVDSTLQSSPTGAVLIYHRATPASSWSPAPAHTIAAPARANVKNFGGVMALDERSDSSVLLAMTATDGSSQRPTIDVWRHPNTTNTTTWATETPAATPLTVTNASPYIPSTCQVSGFAASLALRGDYLVVGAPDSQMTVNGGTSKGAAIVLGRSVSGSTATWSFVSYLSLSSQASFSSSMRNNTDAHFGSSLLLNDRWLVVAAPAVDPSHLASSAVFAMPFSPVSGPTATLTPLTDPDIPGTRAIRAFGQSIGLMGNVIAVGAPIPDDVETDDSASGRIYTFFSTSANDWASLTYPATIGGQRQFGAKIGVSQGNFWALTGSNSTSTDQTLTSLVFADPSVFATSPGSQPLQGSRTQAGNLGQVGIIASTVAPAHPSTGEVTFLQTTEDPGSNYLGTLRHSTSVLVTTPPDFPLFTVHLASAAASVTITLPANTTTNQSSWFPPSSVDGGLTWTIKVGTVTAQSSVTAASKLVAGVNLLQCTVTPVQGTAYTIPLAIFAKPDVSTFTLNLHDYVGPTFTDPYFAGIFLNAMNSLRAKGMILMQWNWAPNAPWKGDTPPAGMRYDVYVAGYTPTPDKPLPPIDSYERFAQGLATTSTAYRRPRNADASKPVARLFFMVTLVDNTGLTLKSSNVSDVLQVYSVPWDSDLDGLPDWYEKMLTLKLTGLANSTSIDPGADNGGGETYLAGYLDGRDGRPLSTTPGYTLLYRTSGTPDFFSTDSGGSYDLPNPYQIETTFGQSGTDSTYDESIMATAMSATANFFHRYAAFSDWGIHDEGPYVLDPTSWTRTDNASPDIPLFDSVTSAFGFFSIKLNGVTPTRRDIPYMVVVQDTPVDPEDPSIQTYSGMVTFTVAAGGQSASSCSLSPGNLPTHVVQKLSLDSDGEFAPSAAIVLRSNPPQGYNRLVSLVPVHTDLDIVHPVTGEVAEEMEDSSSKWVEQGKGGLIALRRNENTPMTKLVLRASPGLPSEVHFRVKWTETLSTASVKVWVDEARTQLVVSQTTEFPADAETTLFLEGVKQGFGEDLKFTQQVKVCGSWVDGDSVSTTVVYSEIPVVLRCFIPHKWTAGEVPVPVDGSVVNTPDGPIFVPVFSNCVGGNRQNYSIKSYRDEPEFKITQKLVMTPYKELHAQTDIASERESKSTPSSDFYKRSEAVPASDQSLTFGEVLVPGATPNWSFAPPAPTAKYTGAGRSGQESHITASLSGQAGHPDFVPNAALPSIDFEFIIKMERMESTLDPYMRVTVDVTQDLYPAYEAIIGKADGTYQHIYAVKPAASTLPGPISLTTSQTGTGGPLDIH